MNLNNRKLFKSLVAGWEVGGLRLVVVGSLGAGDAIVWRVVWERMGKR